MIQLDEFDYNEIIGKKVCSAYIHYVAPEINIVFFELDDCTFIEISGLKGSEVLGIGVCPYERYHLLENELVTYRLFSQFFGKRIASVHCIGNEWNGHGIEIAFEESNNRSIIVQSIYSGSKENGFEDCIKLGLVDYTYTLEKRIDIAKIKEVIDEWDPIELFPMAPSDEYEIEIEHIFQSSTVNTKSLELACIIHEVFTRAFGNIFDSTDYECLKVANRILNS